MAQITVITVGTLKENYLKEAVAEYKKRITQYAKVDEVCLKEERICNEDDTAEINRALSQEGDRIRAAIPDGAYKIALCVEGKEFDSTGLSKVIGGAVDRCGKIALIIGSSHGLCEKIKKESDLMLSFSKLTFPHQLMKVVLLEAIYRSFTILAGKKYHK